MTEGTYIRFVEGTPKPKTKTWAVFGDKDGDGHDLIGCIAWLGRWRKYCFFPEPETVFEQVCLREIAEFCEHETRHHRRKR